MLRAFTSCLWLIAALALGFEAVAQPCDLRAEIATISTHEMVSEMPCHDGMAMEANQDPEGHEMPSHEGQTCCCAALLGNGVTTDATNLEQPVPGLTLWTMPLPDSANSILLEYEPPPPRA